MRLLLLAKRPDDNVSDFDSQPLPLVGDMKNRVFNKTCFDDETTDVDRSGFIKSTSHLSAIKYHIT